MEDIVESHEPANKKNDVENDHCTVITESVDKKSNEGFNGKIIDCKLINIQTKNFHELSTTVNKCLPDFRHNDEYEKVTDEKEISNIKWSHKHIEEYFRRAILSENESSAAANRIELDIQHEGEFKTIIEDEEYSFVVPSNKDIEEYFRNYCILNENESSASVNGCELDIEHKDESGKNYEDKEISTAVHSYKDIEKHFKDDVLNENDSSDVLNECVLDIAYEDESDNKEISTKVMSHQVIENHFTDITFNGHPTLEITELLEDEKSNIYSVDTDIKDVFKGREVLSKPENKEVFDVFSKTDSKNIFSDKEMSNRKPLCDVPEKYLTDVCSSNLVTHDKITVPEDKISNYLKMNVSKKLAENTKRRKVDFKNEVKT